MPSSRPLRLLALLAGLVPLLAGAADAYQYDELGNLQTLTTGTGTHTYSYDEVNRLDQESGPAGARNHAYDANGNRTSDGAGTTATYGANTDRLATINGTTVSLDAAGNLTSDGTNAYTWDAAGRLKTVSRANKLWATYYYDAKSRRSRKETTSRAPQGAQTVVYHYDQDDRLLAETLADGTPLKTYVWHDEGLAAILDHGTSPPTLLTLTTDHLGTPREARNTQGTVVWRWDSDGYGTTPPNEDPDGDGKKTTINLRFPGQYYDLESGLHYNWNRYYSPKLGRYISADPIGVAGGTNMYEYVGGNPIRHTDPKGLEVRFVGSPSEQSALNGAYGIVRATRRGQQLCEELERSKDVYTITGSILGNAYFDPRTNTINVDPNFHPAVPTTEGYQPASIDIILGHELGHAATGTRDDGPGNMNNVNQNENPIRQELRYPTRTAY